MADNDMEMGPYQALRAARDVLSELVLSGDISEDSFNRALDEIEAVRQDLDAGRDVGDLTVPASEALSNEDVERIANAVRQLELHNVGESSARGILNEIFVILGVLTNS